MEDNLIPFPPTGSAIKICRMSGRPVYPEHGPLCLKELSDAHDFLEEKHGKFTQENAPLFQAELNILMEKLHEKYPQIGHELFPSSEKAMRELIMKYEGPICFTIEEDKMIMYVMDH